MNEIREVHHYDDVSTSNNTAMFGIFIVALVALLAIGLAIWQPWAAAPTVTPGRDTTIIERTNDAPPPNNTVINPPDNNTTIINPPVDEPDQTEIKIETPPPTTGDDGGSPN